MSDFTQKKVRLFSPKCPKITYHSKISVEISGNFSFFRYNGTLHSNISHQKSQKIVIIIASSDSIRNLQPHNLDFTFELRGHKFNNFFSESRLYLKVQLMEKKVWVFNDKMNKKYLVSNGRYCWIYQDSIGLSEIPEERFIERLSLSPTRFILRINF